MARGFVFSVDTSKLEKLAVDVGKLDVLANAELIEEALASTRIGVIEARRNAPIFRGTLVSEIRSVPPIIIPGPSGTQVTVGITASDALGVYPDVQEEGRRPGKGPPISVMEDYIRAKVAQGQFNVSLYRGKDKIRAAAFALSRSIGISGTPPFKYFAAGGRAMFAALVKGLNRVVDSFIVRFERG